ncbi:hypothetical protein CEXT_57021 [Caerostris extrusa]|uniref:Uncharacterized protein n=1 Tax=Caerostris extrusa TaxID=172846 RepID=A0AAV4RFN2_CAEEX|nr:hypothetical protein CEXT_57021 [Caerostris extrusa]
MLFNSFLAMRSEEMEKSNFSTLTMLLKRVELGNIKNWPYLAMFKILPKVLIKLVFLTRVTYLAEIKVPACLAMSKTENPRCL